MDIYKLKTTCLHDLTAIVHVAFDTGCWHFNVLISVLFCYIRARHLVWCRRECSRRKVCVCLHNVPIYKTNTMSWISKESCLGELQFILWGVAVNSSCILGKNWNTCMYFFITPNQGKLFMVLNFVLSYRGLGIFSNFPILFFFCCCCFAILYNKNGEET